MTDEKKEEEQLVIPESLPLLPIRDIVIFPFMIVPLFVGRERSISAVDSALTKDRLVLCATQKDISKEDPDPADLYTIGTVCMIMRMLKLPDGRVKVLVQGLTRAHVNKYLETAPSYIVNITKVKEAAASPMPLEVEALMRNVKENLEKLATYGKSVFQEVMMIIDNIQDSGRMADLVAANLGLKIDEAETILETLDPVERLKKAGLEADVRTGLSSDALIAAIGPYHGVIVRSATKITKEVIAAGRNLAVIGRAGFTRSFPLP